MEFRAAFFFRVLLPTIVTYLGFRVKAGEFAMQARLCPRVPVIKAHADSITPIAGCQT